jgi:hypothetical protein
MTTRIAKPVVKNKFWVVEDHGQKVATIQARDDGGFVYVHDEQREFFPSVKVLKQKYNIKFSTPDKKQKVQTNQVYGYPITGKAYNEVYDIKRRLPIYTKTEKSKSQYCAGYYLLLLNNSWSKTFCPKSISVNRYQYLGPFRSQEEMLKKYKEVSNAKT